MSLAIRVGAVGTDIITVHQAERLHDENEARLLNILPRSIAHRLRGEETTIADRFDDMTVRFADVVGTGGRSARDRFGLMRIRTVLADLAARPLVPSRLHGPDR